jgi:hypothetical protein
MPHHITHSQALVRPVFLFQIQQIHPARVAHVDGRVVANEERRRKRADERDSLRVGVGLGPLPVDLSNLVAGEPFIGAGPCNVRQLLRAAHRVLEPLALGRRGRVHPDWRVEDGEGVSELVVEKLVRVGVAQHVSSARAPVHAAVILKMAK